MIRPLIALALLVSGAAAGAVDPPAGKINVARGDVPRARCRGALVVPAGKINTHGHGATSPRCDPMVLAANARPNPAPETPRHDQ